MIIDMTAFLQNQARIATALERIADSFEGDTIKSVSVTGDTATTEKKTRTRRTKEQIAADEAAAAADTVAQTLPGVPPVAMPPVAMPPVATPPVATPPVAAPVAAPAAAAAPVAAPAAAAAPVIAQHAALDVEAQFSHLLSTVIPHNNVPYVRNALDTSIQACGLSMPISDPTSAGALPGEGYRKLSNEQRVSIFTAVANAIAATQASTI